MANEIPINRGVFVAGRANNLAPIYRWVGFTDDDWAEDRDAAKATRDATNVVMPEIGIAFRVDLPRETSAAPHRVHLVSVEQADGSIGAFWVKPGEIIHTSVKALRTASILNYGEGDDQITGDGLARTETHRISVAFTGIT